MANSITCPKCKTEIEITKVMRAQLTMQIRAELETDVAAKQAELDAASRQLDRQRAEVEALQKTFDEQVRAGVEAQREQLLADAVKTASENLAVEIQDRDQRLEELQGKLKASQSNELELRKRERDLQSQKDELQLEVARKLCGAQVYGTGITGGTLE